MTPRFGTHKKKWVYLIRKSKGKCMLCHRRLDYDLLGRYKLMKKEWMESKELRDRYREFKIYWRTALKELGLNIDHIKPVSLGGSNDWENLQIVHSICNYEKGNGVVRGKVYHSVPRRSPRFDSCFD